MGCAQSGQVADSYHNITQPISSPVGILRITITSCHLTNYNSSSVNPYIVVKLAHQMNKTNAKGNIAVQNQIVIKESFNFVINSDRKLFGRVLEVQVWDQGRFGADEVGFGIVDLDQLVKVKILNKTGTDQPMNQQLTYKCWLNHKSSPSGYIYIVASFHEVPYQIFNFRFESATIRKKTRMVGNMNCRVQVTVGQQQISTSRCPDTKQRPPFWLSDHDILKVKVPKHDDVKQCKIGLYDEMELIGEITVPVSNLFAYEVGKQCKQAENTQLSSEQTATLKYSVIRGDNAHFEKKDWMGSKIVTKKDQPKKEQPKKEQEIKKDKQPENNNNIKTNDKGKEQKNQISNINQNNGTTNPKQDNNKNKNDSVKIIELKDSKQIKKQQPILNIFKKDEKKLEDNPLKKQQDKKEVKKQQKKQEKKQQKKQDKKQQKKQQKKEENKQLKKQEQKQIKKEEKQDKSSEQKKQEKKKQQPLQPQITPVVPQIKQENPKPQQKKPVQKQKQKPRQENSDIKITDSIMINHVKPKGDNPPSNPTIDQNKHEQDKKINNAEVIKKDESKHDDNNMKDSFLQNNSNLQSHNLFQANLSDQQKQKLKRSAEPIPSPTIVNKAENIHLDSHVKQSNNAVNNQPVPKIEQNNGNSSQIKINQDTIPKVVEQQLTS